jgi:hypothetical protein
VTSHEAHRRSAGQGDPRGRTSHRGFVETRRTCGVASRPGGSCAAPAQGRSDSRKSRFGLRAEHDAGLPTQRSLSVRSRPRATRQRHGRRADRPCDEPRRMRHGQGSTRLPSVRRRDRSGSLRRSARAGVAQLQQKSSSDPSGVGLLQLSEESSELGSSPAWQRYPYEPG